MATLTLVDVGHGGGAVVTGSDGTVLLDAGPGTSVLEYLRQEGIDEVSLVLVSHADADHLKGLLALLAAEEVTVHEVRLNSDAQKTSALWLAVTVELDRLHRAKDLEYHVALVEGEEFIAGDATTSIRVLAPSQFLASRGPGSTDADGDDLTTNTASAVFQVRSNDQPVALLAGDIDQVGLKHLRSNVSDQLPTPTLVYPHHGGNVRDGATAADNIRFAREVIAAVEPSFVVFSVGRGLHGTPRPEIVATVRQVAPDVRIACTQLSRNCADSLPSLDPPHLVPAFARGRLKRSCCSGTVRLAIADGAAVVTPTHPAHLAFVRASAPTALCLATPLAAGAAAAGT